MKRKVSLLMVAAAISVACTSEVDQQPNISDKTSMISVTLDANQQETNASTSKAAFKDGAFEWRKGDQLLVKSGDKSETFAMTSGQFTNSATFEGSLELNATQYIHAVQCGSRTGTTGSFEGTSYTFSQIATQQQNHFGTAESNYIDPATVAYYTYMYGKSTNQVDADNTSSPISMKHATAIVDFKISNLPSYKIANKLTLTSSTGLVSAITVDVDNSSITEGEKNINTLSIALSTAGTTGIVSASGELTVRVAMLPQTIAAGTEWSIVLECEGKTFETTKQFTSDLVIEGGALYPAPITFDDDAFDGTLDKALIAKEYIATASYEREFTIAVNATSAWSVTELEDDKDGFTIISPADGAMAQAGDNLVIKVTENTDTEKIYNAAYRVVTTDGTYDVVNLKQSNAIATSPFVLADWGAYNYGVMPTFENGQFISQNQWAVKKSTKSIKLEVGSFIHGNGLQFMVFPQSGKYQMSSMLFDVAVWANTFDCKWPTSPLVDTAIEGLVTDAEKALFEKKGLAITKGDATHTFEIMAYPTPEGNVWTFFANGQYITEVTLEVSNRELAGGLGSTMFKGTGPNAITAKSWGESTIGYDDAQWNW